jgi:hypothetical protein
LIFRRIFNFGRPWGRKGITDILNIYAILSVIGLIIFLSLVKNKPKFAPNPIAVEKKLTMTAGLCCCFIGMGAFNAILTKIEFIFKSRSLGIEMATAAGLITPRG